MVNAADDFAVNLLPKITRLTGPADLAPDRPSHFGEKLSFQAYLDNIEEKTGLTPRQFIGLAQAKGYDSPDTKAGSIIEWLKEDFDLGRGHAMALVHVIKNGPKIDAKHVDSDGSHRDESDLLWLDGKATHPA
jgi:Domain of unknown function (DUF4287)